MLPLGRVAVGLPLHLLLPLIVADTDVTSTDASSVLGATVDPGRLRRSTGESTKSQADPSQKGALKKVVILIPLTSGTSLSICY